MIPDEHEWSLRTWARGIRPLEAAVELLIRFSAGKYSRPGLPWTRVSDAGRSWVDFQAMPLAATGLPERDRRVLDVAASLGDGVPIDLGLATVGLDQEAMVLVLAAIAHAGTDPAGGESVLAWPGE